MYNAKIFILQMNAVLMNFLFWNFVSLKVSNCFNIKIQLSNYYI